MLTYERVKYISPETEIVVLKVPTSWGMFTNSGNKRITELAKRFVDVLENSTDIVAQTKAAVEFLQKYKKLSSTKSYSEASDTEVREQVGYFFSQACKCAKIDDNTIWERFF